jgi:hypothetical protein
MEIDAYDYDKSLFYRLLESQPKFKTKYEFVQERQGVIVCPLEFKQSYLKKFKTYYSTANSSNSSPSFDFIDLHLYLPSPFYKNHYIPLSSLAALSSLNLNSSSGGSSVLLDHSQHIYLILNDDQEGQPNEFVLINKKKQKICKQVKLLGIQKNYTENNNLYKVLIVNKPVYFRPPSISVQPFSGSSSKSKMLASSAAFTLNQINSDLDEENDENGYQLDQDDSSDNEHGSIETNMNTNNFYASNGSSKNSPAKRNKQSTKGPSNTSEFNSINQVKSFGKSIDFLHDFVGLVSANDYFDGAKIRVIKYYI